MRRLLNLTETIRREPFTHSCLPLGFRDAHVTRLCSSFLEPNALSVPDIINLTASNTFRERLETHLSVFFIGLLS